MIFDTHAHYDDEAFDGDRDELLAGLPAAGIGRVVNIAASPRSIDECLDLAHRFPHVYCALGIHPEHCAEMTEELLEEIRGKLADDKAVAVGEIGLDYYWPEPDREIQKHWFARQLQLAREVDMPVVRGHDEDHERKSRRGSRRRGALLFLQCGDGERICEDGILHRYWRSPYF